jgi:pimeloyl-ACP methyl ester carboxylesterase
VHGSLSDYTYWSDQIAPLAKHYHVFAYSRRYNYPNNNPIRRGYSAVADADDLAAFLLKLKLGQAVVVGHSYGALAALFLAVRHPAMVHVMVLAEPPAVSLLAELSGKESEKGREMLADIRRRMVEPMKADFGRGDTDAGIAAFMTYVFKDPTAWQNMSATARRETLRNAEEWNVMLTTGTLFPDLSAQQVRSITIPTLLMSGARSYSFLQLINQELGRLLPHSQSLIFPDAGHQMWNQNPDACREAVDDFLARNGIK